MFAFPSSYSFSSMPLITFLKSKRCVGSWSCDPLAKVRICEYRSFRPFEVCNPIEVLEISACHIGVSRAFGRIGFVDLLLFSNSKGLISGLAIDTGHRPVVLHPDLILEGVILSWVYVWEQGMEQR